MLRDVAAAEETVEREIRAACAAYPDDIAALILEPIQGEGGDNHFRPELFRRLRALADELEFLLIFDEVQTGVGLTGSMWCWQQMGVEPDMFAFGKKTQVCGFASNHRIDDIPDNVFKVSSRINSTWGGNLVDMIRCGKYLEIIAEDNLIENAGSSASTCRAACAELAAEFPGVMTNVRGRGLFVAFDLPDKETRDRTLAACLENGMMGLASGRQRHPLPAAPDPLEGRSGRGVRKLRRAICRRQEVAASGLRDPAPPPPVRRRARRGGGSVLGHPAGRRARWRASWPKTTAFMERRKARLVARGQEHRASTGRPSRSSRIAPDLQRAVVVAEDARFWEHDGRRLGGDARRAREELGEGGDQGRRLDDHAAARQEPLPLPGPHALAEAAGDRDRAAASRSELSKKRILELYLNVIEFGPRTFGVEAAARRYSASPRPSLSREEAADARRRHPLARASTTRSAIPTASRAARERILRWM